MYEAQTYEEILERMLDRIPGDIDKREGSIIFDALAPAAAEISQMYAQLEMNYNLSFADTASGDFLSKRTAEFGVNRKAAANALRQGLFFNNSDQPFDVPIGSRYSIGGINYMVVSRLFIGKFELESEEEGNVGNQQFGTLLPIDYVNGLVRAELTDIIVPGAEAESDESLRTRFLAAVNDKPFGGNVADYLQKVGSLPGVGGVKVFPVWQGGGTVKVTIVDSTFDAPAAGLLDDVQTVIDPTANAGEGIGYAPIGHKVTIAGAAGVTINIVTTITLRAGYTIGQIEDDIRSAITLYARLLRGTWAAESALVFRVSQMESRILGVEGVADVTSTTLNGMTANIELGVEQIPVIGTVTLNE
ncbi:baseplate J/gp47 family protein [Cohnella abietis]|uniref:Phage tail protein n=1 Tax=Cohnella abietis TaxID=2507935 RepID=A0A3T1D1U5_9BACL|nr:baseplate J/gp47 family protein [Cohnella abietis]BBI32054.1 phage tail protein [Cohnella abietis]